MPVDTHVLPPRYEHPEPIGRGAMGEIYRATDTALGRAVAVKVLAPRFAADEGVRRRFTREALAAARLSGAPHVVTIFDVGEWGERPFLVMEYLPGGSLEERIRREGAQPPGRALAWLEQAARALDAAHAQGIVHRDVKPANLLLDGDGGLHVADFGVASAAGMDSLTQTGTILGTAGYLSPEQARGERATPASDLYAVGVVAFELLTGSRPFRGESATAEAAAHLHQAVPSACERNPELPCELDPVFERALAKDPAARFATAGDFVAELRHALDEAAGGTQVAPAWPGADGPPVATVPLRRPRSRTWIWIVAGLVALAAIGAGLAAALTRGGSDEAAPSAPRVTTVLRTVTAQGTPTTVQVTTTAAAPTPTQPATSAPSPPADESGAALNDQGFALMQQGDYDGALPLLEQAVTKLDGTGSLAEAYADYNLAFTRLALGNCDGVTDLLAESEAIQGHRHEIDRAQKQARKQCG